MYYNKAVAELLIFFTYKKIVWIIKDYAIVTKEMM